MPRDVAALWRTACPLKLAPVKLGPQSMAEEYTALISDPPIVRFVQAMAENVAAGRQTSEAFKQADHETKRLEKLQGLLRSQVRGALRRGQLVGLGFAAPRQPDAGPVQVPLDVWGGTIDWDKGTVTGNGLRFDGVRIATAETVAPRGPGRESLRAEIVAAFERLAATGRIDFAKPLSSHFPLIRETVMAENPNRRRDQGKGMSPQTLQRHLGKRFNAGKHAD